MKILHMSDLHLGAKTEGHSRISEQKQTLAEIVEIANKNSIDIVAIAGDIFHVATPSAEAEDLFYEFLEQLTKNNNRVVLVVAGNHDDPKRLACCLPLAKSHNIVICTDLSTLPTYKQQGLVQIISTDRGFVKIKKESEIVCAALLPYAIKSRIEQSIEKIETIPQTTYENQVKEWAKIPSRNFEKSTFNLFVAHQYIIGAKEQLNGKQQVVSVGSALAVSPSIFPDCNYVALGHLHTNQLVKGTKNIYYSGATTRLRIYDENPCINIVDTKSSEVKKIELKSPSKIIKLEATSQTDAIKNLKKVEDNCIVYLQFTKTTSLSNLEIKELKNVGPVVVAISFAAQKTHNAKTATNAKDYSPEQLFSLFVKEKTGGEPSNEMMQMFLSLMEEQNETPNT